MSFQNIFYPIHFHDYAILFSIFLSLISSTLLTLLTEFKTVLFLFDLFLTSSIVSGRDWFKVSDRNSPVMAPITAIPAKITYGYFRFTEVPYKS